MNNTKENLRKKMKENEIMEEKIDDRNFVLR